MSMNDGGQAFKKLYDPAIALEFFKSGGKPETIKQGATLFAENEKASRLLLQRDKMYLLLEGEVSLVAGKKLIGSVAKGETFGEMAPIGQAARSASAVAKTDCRVIGLDDKQFQNALRKKPEFALMLMSIMIGRLRETIARLRGDSAPSSDGTVREARLFDAKLMAALVRELADDPPVRYASGKAIITEGQAGLLMYVVLEGRVAASIHGSLVEMIGPGGVFGEIALVDPSPRVASASAETDCSLLAINRKAFLDMVKSSPEFGISLLGALADRTRVVTSRLK